MSAFFLENIHDDVLLAFPGFTVHLLAGTFWVCPWRLKRVLVEIFGKWLSGHSCFPPQRCAEFFMRSCGSVLIEPSARFGLYRPLARGLLSIRISGNPYFLFRIRIPSVPANPFCAAWEPRNHSFHVTSRVMWYNNYRCGPTFPNAGPHGILLDKG